MSDFISAVVNGLFVGRSVTVSGTEDVQLQSMVDGKGDTYFVISPPPGVNITGLTNVGEAGTDWWQLVIGTSVGRSVMLAAGQNKINISTLLAGTSETFQAQVVHVFTLYGIYMTVEAWSNPVTTSLTAAPPNPFPLSSNADTVGGINGQAGKMGDLYTPQSGTIVAIQLFKNLETSPFQTVVVDLSKRLMPFRINPVGQIKSLQTRIYTIGYTAGLDMSRLEVRGLKQLKAGA